jgi:hypothetical protein
MPKNHPRILTTTLSVVVLSFPLPAQDPVVRLREARTSYETGMEDILRRAEDVIRRGDDPPAKKLAPLKALLERGELNLPLLVDLRAEAEQRRGRLLEALEVCADTLMRKGKGDADQFLLEQLLLEQMLWLRIQDTLPWRRVVIDSLQKQDSGERVWTPPAAASSGYRLHVRGSAEPKTVAAVELTLAHTQREFSILRVPVVDGRFDVMVTVGPEGQVALDLGVVRGSGVFAAGESKTVSIRIPDSGATLTLDDLWWKPLVLRPQAETAPSEGEDVGVSDKPEGRASQETKDKVGKPVAAAANAKATMWAVGTRVAGWRTNNGTSPNANDDCSIHGEVSRVTEDRIVFDLRERFLTKRGRWATPDRQWVWRRTGFDKKTGEILLELVSALGDGKVVTKNPRGTARLKDNVMRGTYRIDFTNGVLHHDTEKAHEWILEVSPR